MTHTYMEPIVSAPVTNEGLCRAFRASLLLTGNAGQAEAALLDAIRSTDREESSDRMLFSRAAMAALSLSREAPARTEDLEHASALLPLELRPVLRLSVEPRHCFVLRVLAGMSREECSRLLHRDIRQVDEGACAGAQELANASQHGY